MNELAARIAARIRREGSLPFSTFMDLALYDETHGFYATGGEPGRRGDFLTSPETGPLFGAVLARAIDAWWIELGRPDPYTVVECGAGPGTLARAILAASPVCGHALRLVLVERSGALRAKHPVEARVESRATMPEGPIVGVILANELLDNLAFELLLRSANRWVEARVGLKPDGRLHFAGDVPLPDAPTTMSPDAANGAVAPFQWQAAHWLETALARVARGRVVVIDYMDTTESMSLRPHEEWLRTYRRHERGGHPLDDPGTQDITCEVAKDQLAGVREPDLDRSQAEFLRAHGIDELVAEGRRIWAERGHVGDLAALRGRSRIREAEALCDAEGLGAFRVLEWLTP